MNNFYKKVKRINRSMLFFILVVFIIRIIIYLSDKDKIILPSNVKSYLSFFLVVSVTFFIINLLLRLTVNRIFNSFEKELEVEQRIFLTKLYSIFWYIIGISLILSYMGLALKDITLILGFFATGFAFAIRDIIMSFFIWLIILSKKPFRHNDVISTGDELGRVERIGTFYITLRTSRGDVLKIPNKIYFDKPIKNYGSKFINFTLNFPLKKRIKLESLQEYNELLKDLRCSAELIYEGDNLFLRVDCVCKLGVEKELRTNIFYDVTEKFNYYIWEGKINVKP